MTDPATEARVWTLDAWGALAEDEPGELVDGRLVEEEMPTRLHEAVVAWLFFELKKWAERSGARIYGSELKIAIGEGRGRKPDLSVYVAGTPRSGARAAVQRLPPDVVVEVVSPSPKDARRDRIEKPDDYAAAGVPYYWIVDPELRSFEVWERDERGRYARASSATGGELAPPGCPGLVLPLDGLWAELDDELAGD